MPDECRMTTWPFRGTSPMTSSCATFSSSPTCVRVARCPRRRAARGAAIWLHSTSPTYRPKTSPRAGRRTPLLAGRATPPGPWPCPAASGVPGAPGIGALASAHGPAPVAPPSWQRHVVDSVLAPRAQGRQGREDVVVRLHRQGIGAQLLGEARRPGRDDAMRDAVAPERPNVGRTCSLRRLL